MSKFIKYFVIISSLLVSFAHAQFATLGGGMLVTDRPLKGVAEINVQTPPFLNSRAYATFSWTNDSAKPTYIFALERKIFGIDKVFTTGLGAGMLMIEPKDYKPDFMVVSSTFVPLPIPKTAVVVIGSVLPFEKFEWSLILKVGWAFWFVK